MNPTENNSEYNFKNYLSDATLYDALALHIQNCFDKEITDLHYWEYPYYGTTFSNGQPFRDGNPIFSAINRTDKHVIRIVLDEDIKEVTHFTKELEDGLYEDIYVLNLENVLTELNFILKNIAQKKFMLIKRKIYDVLVDSENKPGGWFYLPESSNNWTLETEGIFVDDEFGENEEETQELVDKGWTESLDATTIEDVIFNAKEQKNNVTPDELLEAFVFYFENDAFINFN